MGDGGGFPRLCMGKVRYISTEKLEHRALSSPCHSIIEADRGASEALSFYYIHIYVCNAERGLHTYVMDVALHDYISLSNYNSNHMR